MGKNIIAKLLTNKDFFDWAKALRHVPPPPPGFTSNYLWKLESGIATFWKSPEDENPTTFVFCRSLASTRRAILEDLIGKIDCGVDALISSPLALQNTPPLQLKEKKLLSLAKKYKHIPDKYKKFYPTPPEVDASVQAEPNGEDDKAAEAPPRTLGRPVGSGRKAPEEKPAPKRVGRLKVDRLDALAQPTSVHAMLLRASQMQQQKVADLDEQLAAQIFAEDAEEAA